MQFIKNILNFLDFYLINKRIEKIRKENKSAFRDSYSEIGDHPNIPDEFYTIMKDYKRTEV